MPWSGTLSDNVISHIDFIDEAVVQRCFGCKNTFVGAGNLQMITSNFDLNTCGGLMYSFWTQSYV